MTEVDVGVPSQAVYTRLEYDVTGKLVAAFVSRYGDVFCLAEDEVELRIRYLRANGSAVAEESRALAALRAARG